MSIGKYNAEGYCDPTPYKALTEIHHKEINKTRIYRPLVYICSPFAENSQRNIENTRRFCRFAVSEGAIPLAPHLHYPQFMDDSDPVQRKDGLWFALILLCKTDEVWVFGERIYESMKIEIANARKKDIPIRFYNSDCERCP